MTSPKEESADKYNNAQTDIEGTAKMTDVLLIQPLPMNPEIYSIPENELYFNAYKAKTRITRVPQGLLLIGTVLYNSGYNVDILDTRLHYTTGREHLLGVLKKRSNDVRLLVGISVMTADIPSAIEIMDTIKKVSPNIPIVLGGIHPTLYPKQTCEDDSVDFVIAGDGEYPMVQLVEALDKGKSYRDIKGLTYKDGHHVISNPIDKPFDIRELGVPAYHLLEMENYLHKIPYFSEEETIGLDYYSSRGCSYNCAFCVNKILPQNRIWRYKTADQVIQDLHILKDKYRFDFLNLEEENPFTNMERALEIANKLIEDDFNICYFGNIRADVVVNTPKNVLKTLRRSGWCETGIGVESGSNKVLAYLRKNITVEQTIQAARILNELGVYAYYSLMKFLPHETRDDRRLTYALMRELKHIHPKSMFLGPQPFRPYAGSDLYQYCLDEGLIEPKTFREWPNFITGEGHPSEMQWVRDYTPIDRLLEKYFYSGDHGLKEIPKKVVKRFLRK